MRTLVSFLCERRASAAVEFALAAPIILLTVCGILQVGQLFEARAGLKYAMDESARYAGLYPRPADSDIQARFDAKRFGLNASLLTTSITHGTSTAGDYVDITAAYQVQSQFVFFTGPAIRMQETRRAFQP